MEVREVNRKWYGLKRNIFLEEVENLYIKKNQMKYYKKF